MSHDLRVAGAAWMAYRTTVGGMSFNGEALPTWPELLADPLKSKIVNAWVQAGMAACSIEKQKESE